MTPRPYHYREPRQPGQRQECGVLVHYPSPPVRWDLVRVLETVLKDARSGQLQYFTGTGLMANRCRMGVYGGDCDNVFAMAGAIEWLKREFMDRIEREVG